MIKIVISFLFILSSMHATSLKVAVSANVRFAFDEIIQKYHEKNSIKIIPIIASSGKLTAQIEHGAPFDLFLSANMKYPNYLYEKKLAISKPKIYAYGTLVLWGLNTKVEPSLENLKNKNIKKIAIPNPKIAPYGVEAIKVLEKHGLKNKLQSKIVFGDSVSQTNQYIYSRAADIGITAKSVVLSPKMSNIGKYIELDHKDYSPIKQGVVILKYGKTNNTKASQNFYDFLFSNDAKIIFKKYGYLIP